MTLKLEISVLASQAAGVTEWCQKSWLRHIFLGVLNLSCCITPYQTPSAGFCFDQQCQRVLTSPSLWRHNVVSVGFHSFVRVDGLWYFIAVFQSISNGCWYWASFYVLSMIHILPPTMSIKILCQCFNWVILLKAYSREVFFLYPYSGDILSFSRCLDISSFSLCITFSFFDIIFQRINALFWCSLFSLFSLMSVCFGFYIWKL